MTDWSIAFIISTALAAAGFVVVAVLWLRKLRDALSNALGETARQQVNSTQRLGETIARMQQQQQLAARQIESLVDANIRLRQDINQLAGRLETTEQKAQSSTPTRIVH